MALEDFQKMDFRVLSAALSQISKPGKPVPGFQRTVASG
jgi:hypothetical protein